MHACLAYLSVFGGIKYQNDMEMLFGNLKCYENVKQQHLIAPNPYLIIFRAGVTHSLNRLNCGANAKIDIQKHCFSQIYSN